MLPILDAQGYQGSTPHVFWGNYLLIGLSVIFLLVMGFKTRYERD